MTTAEATDLADVLRRDYPDLIEAQMKADRAHEAWERYTQSVSAQGRGKSGSDWTQKEREAARELLDSAIEATGEKETELAAFRDAQGVTPLEAWTTLKQVARQAEVSRPSVSSL